ncbi:MAG: TlpA family protein disulfide reductase, partial [Proteobacteria bacterium]|nr:TlpA family protein disulfide reductase [Pseudomonadota bacterium]
MVPLVRAALLTLVLSAAGWAQEVVPSGIRTGEPLPALTGVDLEGNPVALSSFLGRGSVVLSFWSVHCTDCIRELDDLRSIRREFPPEEVAVVAVNTDSGLPVERVAGFVRRYESSRGPLEVAHLLDRNASILTALGIRYIPVLVVLDRAGRVSSVFTGYQTEDRARVAQAMEEGRVALGAWSESLRGRVRTLLRGPAPGGGSVEWGTFRAEAGAPLFGLYDATGWIADAAGRRDRAGEAKRVE